MSAFDIGFLIFCGVGLVACIGALCWSIPMYLRLKRDTEKK